SGLVEFVDQVSDRGWSRAERGEDLGARRVLIGRVRQEQAFRSDRASSRQSVGSLDQPHASWRETDAGRLPLLTGRFRLGHSLARRLELDAERLQHAGSDTLALARDAEQEVLGADVTVTELTSLVDRELDDLLDPRRQRDLARRRRRVAAPDGELDRRTDLRELHTQRIEHPHPNALALAHESEKEMLSADVV